MIVPGRLRGAVEAVPGEDRRRGERRGGSQEAATRDP
jgi:hypothetical protein